MCVHIFIYDIKAFEKVIAQNKEVNRERGQGTGEGNGAYMS